MAQKPDVSELVQRIEQLENKLKIYYTPNADKVLEDVLEKLDTRTVMLILREVDARDLALAMMGLQQKALQQIKNAMSKTSWNMIKDDLYYHMKWSIYGSAVKDAKITLMNIVQQLVHMGEIMIPEGLTKESTSINDSKKKWDEEKNKRIKEMEVWKKEVFDPLENS